MFLRQLAGSFHVFRVEFWRHFDKHVGWVLVNLGAMEHFYCGTCMMIYNTHSKP